MILSKITIEVEGATEEQIKSVIALAMDELSNSREWCEYVAAEDLEAYDNLSNDILEAVS